MRLAIDGISARLSGVWARSSPEAAKRGVRDAGLEVGHIPTDHRTAVWSFIASDMSDRSPTDRVPICTVVPIDPTLTTGLGFTLKEALCGCQKSATSFFTLPTVV